MRETFYRPPFFVHRMVNEKCLTKNVLIYTGNLSIIPNYCNAVRFRRRPLRGRRFALFRQRKCFLRKLRSAQKYHKDSSTIACSYCSAFGAFPCQPHWFSINETPFPLIVFATIILGLSCFFAFSIALFISSKLCPSIS